MSLSIIDELPKNEIYNDGISGLKLSYRYLKNKNKKTIVFLHGYNGNSKSWAYQFKFFKHNYSLISFDFPGFGESDNMKDPDMFKVSNLIIRALENLKIKEYYIIGHSM